MGPVLYVSWKDVKPKCKQNNKTDQTNTLQAYLCSHIPTGISLTDKLAAFI